ncbi:hypothetical protein [Terrarubrum flagellatum]|uniref:hypothetical protein n=1 Tax=Terrirubrum flagellatum TaxID=2895980 RepID=UPI0031453BFA
MISTPAIRTLFAATMGVAGFLLFQVQPMLAKYILPWFGGAATTWIVCMLFFQMALLAGYAYAYALTRPMTVAKQALAQIALLAVMLLLLPITPAESWKPVDAGDPTWRIVALLAATVGGPYLVLATTSPLITRWFASLDPKANPSQLFAVSNFGSFLGLLSYPFAFEGAMTTGVQTRVWSWAFVAYAILFAVCSLVTWRAHPRSIEQANEATPEKLESSRIARWILYSAFGSILLLATTNQITQWSAVIPFLWIAPLALYLLSFTLAFGRQHGGDLRLYALAFLIIAAIVLVSGRPDTPTRFVLDFIAHIAALFAGCMVCHAEVVRLQPGPRQLPAFYLAMSIGGAIGGLLVALAAPLVFSEYREFPIILGVVGAMSAYIFWRDRKGGSMSWLTPVGALGAAGFAAGLGVMVWREAIAASDVVDRARNFYGVVSVARDQWNDPEEANLVMRQAGVDQGSQFRKPERKMEPSCAFNQASALGKAVQFNAKRRANPNAPLRIGIVGLGAGMIAGLGRDGDLMRYYELNPAVLDLVNKHFTFVRDGKAKVEVALGDGRLVLERELANPGPQKFDILVINAFRGASPPMHLMTEEAFKTYLAHLAQDGILAVNFELDTFEIAPLHRGLAKALNIGVRWVETPADETECEDVVSWALYSRDDKFWEVPQVKASISPWRDGSDSLLLWTDASSNLMSIVNWRGPKDDD